MYLPKEPVVDVAQSPLPSILVLASSLGDVRYMIALFLLAVQVASADSSTWPSVNIADGGSARYLAPIIDDADYPAEAKAAGAEGATMIEVLVAPNGQIEECQVVASSGRVDFDERSCALYKERAKFEINGRSTPAKFRLRIMWLLR